MKLAERCLESSAPRLKWDEMIRGTGADLRQFDRKLALDRTARVVFEVRAKRSGIVSRCDARMIGEIIRDLGRGRHTQESAINYGVGVDQIRKPGEPVRVGTTLCRIHAIRRNDADTARRSLQNAFDLVRSLAQHL